MKWSSELRRDSATRRAVFAPIPAIGVIIVDGVVQKRVARRSWVEVRHAPEGNRRDSAGALHSNTSTSKRL